MDIRIYRSFDDAALKTGWDRLVSVAEVLPQSSHHWCHTWWQHLGRNMELHIVTVMDADNMLGVAPMAIESQFGLRVLRSIPINYCDYFTVVVEPGERALSARSILAEYLTKFQTWSAVMIQQVNSDDPLCSILTKTGFQASKMVDCIITNLSSENWLEYRNSLSRKLRTEVKKKRDDLERNFEITLETVESASAYKDHFDLLNTLYNLRWADDYRPARSNAYQTCLLETVTECFRQNKMILYLLRANGRILAYRLGFMKDQSFYDWNTSYDVAFRQYSPGQIILSYIIEDLMARGYRTINFMAGFYEYKLRWSPDRRITTNKMFIAVKPGLRGTLFSRYHLIWRDKLKTRYHAMLNSPAARRVSRMILGRLGK